MARGLTDLAIRNLKPGGKRREIPDPGQRGLYVQLQPSGARGFAVRYRLHGKPCKLTLPGGVTLAQARKLAGDVLYDVARGVDPAEHRRAQREKVERAKADTLRAVAEEYFKREGKNLRTLDQRMATFERLIFPILGGGTPIGAIRRKDVVRLLDKVEDERGPRMADVALAGLSRLFNWHAVRDDTFTSPVVKGMRREQPSERARDRILNDDELRALWQAAEQRSDVVGPLVKFSLYTACRRGEAAGMPWTELVADQWVLSPARNKVGRELTRPLAEPVLKLLDELPQLGPYVFSITGQYPFAGFSRAKHELDEASGVTGWTWHDLRRTSRSLMSRAGVASDIAEMCLGHVLPAMRGVYDRHSYRAEKTTAYAVLARLIGEILHPPEADNVVELELRRR
jgi:integrase